MHPVTTILGPPRAGPAAKPDGPPGDRSGVPAARPGGRRFVDSGDLVRESGLLLPAVTICYESWGRLNKAGDNAVLVADTQATPVMAQDVIRRIREVTDKPIKYVVLTHYHAVRVLGASAYGSQEIIARADTRDLIVEGG